MPEAGLGGLEIDAGANAAMESFHALLQKKVLRLPRIMASALVSKPTDVGTMADHIESLLVDDDARMRLASAGREYVRRFDWDESARMLDAIPGALPGRSHEVPATGERAFERTAVIASYSGVSSGSR